MTGAEKGPGSAESAPRAKTKSPKTKSRSRIDGSRLLRGKGGARGGSEEGDAWEEKSRAPMSVG
jgi:hypothetical protein